MPSVFPRPGRSASALLWLALLSVYVLAGTPLVPFHADEATQIYLTHDYAYLFMERDPARLQYRPEPPEPDLQALRILNGSLARYAMGLSWHLAGYQLADINGQWDWGADRDYNQRAGHEPSPSLLLVSRWPSALLLVASVWLLFALGQVAGGRAVAYLASAYYALNPAVLLNGRRAMMEGSLLLTELLVVLASLYFLSKRTLVSALLLGVAAGLALAAKHSNALTVALVFAACGGYALLERLALRRVSGDALVRSLALLLAASALAVAGFVALNPVWWGQNPLHMLGRTLNDRAALLDLQIALFGGYGGRADQLAGFFRQAFVVLPQYYEAPEFGLWIAGEIARYEGSLLRGVSIGGSLPGSLLVIALAALGAWALLRRQDIPLATRWVTGVWALGLLLATWLLTPLEWQRYYLPVYPAIGLLGALGVAQAARFGRSP